MKTNHQRLFVATDDKPNLNGNLKKYGTGYGDATNGHRGQARQKAGKKKYIRSRRRFAENAQTNKLKNIEAGLRVISKNGLNNE